MSELLSETRDVARWRALLVLVGKVNDVSCENAKEPMHHTGKIKNFFKADVGFKLLDDKVKRAILLGMDSTRPGAPAYLSCCHL